MKKHYSAAIVACLVSAGLAYGINPSDHESDIGNQVRHKLASLPYYTVFDNLAYKVDGTKVTIMGQVVNPALPDEATAAVKEISGVTGVINEIEILPPSSMDAGIRWAVFRAIYRDPALQRYGEPVVPTIHIIVKDGNVTLIGMVATQGDKAEAYIRASSVPGTFQVHNNLVINPSV